MNSILLVIFTLWSILPVVATAPTLPSNVKGFDLNKEMDVFKDLLRKQFEKAKMKVETAKLRNVKRKRTVLTRKVF